MKQKLPALQISNKVQNIPEALSIYMNQLVYSLKRKGESIQVLSLGEAYFDIPMFDFNKLDFTKGYHYSESRGLPELRKKIAEYYLKHYSAPINDENEILISAGSKPIIFMAIQAVLNEGDEVLMPEPAWLSYPEQVKLAGGVPKYIPYYEPVENFVNYFTKKTRMLIINNPNNPSGKRYTKEELEKIYHMCRNRGIYVLSDEAYSDFIIGDPFTSLINVAPDKDGVIVVNSLSKNFGISGWRIGYIVAAPRVIDAVLKLNQHLITCGPTILNMYLARYFDDLIAITLPQAKEVVEHRKVIDEYMTEIGLDHLEGDATFYLFVNIGNYKYSSLDFCLYLLFKYHIAAVPGSAYGASTERFIRIGVGVETVESLKNTIKIIKNLIETDEYDEGVVTEGLDSIKMRKFEA